MKLQGIGRTRSENRKTGSMPNQFSYEENRQREQIIGYGRREHKTDTISGTIIHVSISLRHEKRKCHREGPVQLIQLTKNCCLRLFNDYWYNLIEWVKM